jgi:hypothetical protein
MATPEYQRPRQEPEISGWAAGGIVFAATVLLMIGIFQAIAGLVAIIDDDFYVVTRNYTFNIDTTAWGWIHLILGTMVTAVGWSLFSRRAWAGVAAITIALLTAIANFLFIPYYPFWAILQIALAVWVIWSLTRPGAIET